jgi:protein SCO1/2
MTATPAPPARPSRLGAWLTLLALAGLGAGLWLGLGRLDPAPPPPPTLVGGTLLPQPRPLEPFRLTAHDGTPFELSSLEGHWSFLTFGYTQCPDVCPMVLTTLNAVAARIPDRTPRPEFVFVSVDPERDTPEQLGRYVAYFNPAFRGVTGPDPALQRLTGQLGVLYARAEQQDTAMGYLVDHSASVLLIDPAGRLAAVFSAPQDPAAMARDFTTITTTFTQGSPPRAANGG